MTSNDNGLITIKTLQCIKRREKVFSRYIKEYCAAHVLLDQDLLLKEIKVLAKYLTCYKAQDILVLSSNLEHHSCYTTFAQLLQYRILTTTYKRGTFNNYLQDGFLEARVLFTCHDRRDRLAITDGKRELMKIVGFSNFARGYKYYDYFVPANTFSKQAMIVSFYLLYKYIKQEHGEPYIQFQEFKNLAE